MSDPTPNPAEQDPVNAGPPVRLRIVLALLRVLAGRRGHSEVAWSGQGFVYHLSVARGGPVPTSLDVDPTAMNGAEAEIELRDRLAE